MASVVGDWILGGHRRRHPPTARRAYPPASLGPRLLGYDNVELSIFGHRAGLASWLRYLGHSVGSIVAVALMWHIGRCRLVDEWYGHEVVSEARAFHGTPQQRVAFWLVVGGGLAAGSMWGWHGDQVEQILRAIVAVAIAAVLVHLVRPVRIAR